MVAVVHIKNVLTVARVLLDGNAWEILVFRPTELLDPIPQRVMTLVAALLEAAMVAVAAVVVAVLLLHPRQLVAVRRLDAAMAAAMVAMVEALMEAAVVRSGAVGFRGVLAARALLLLLVQIIATSMNQRLATQLLVVVLTSPVTSVLSATKTVNARVG